MSSFSRTHPTFQPSVLDKFQNVQRGHDVCVRGGREVSAGGGASCGCLGNYKEGQDTPTISMWSIFSFFFVMSFLHLSCVSYILGCCVVMTSGHPV